MAQPEKQSAVPLPERSPTRQRVFTLVVYSIPVVFFVLLEMGLRLGGFGQTYPLFIPNESYPDYVLANPEVVKRYFPDPSNAAKVSIDIAFFKTKKKPGAVRIFVQGGSTAAGFPFGLGASLAGMLKHRLQRTFPDREIEVISTALSAVNSYTLLDLSDEILEYEPDAILIYTGHNEYLGILGVGSAFAGGIARPLVRAFLQLRDFRTFQILQRAVASIRRFFSEEVEETSGGTLMAHLAASKHIPYNSDLYDKGIDQFEGNLNALLARYQKLGIPVFMGTLVSNERDQKPFISSLAPGTDARVWKQHYQAGTEASQRGDTNAAAEALEAAIRLDDAAANAYYAKGQLLEKLGDYQAARQAYLAAKDRDQLRFRAPEKFNQVIRGAAKRYGATVVEVQEAFIEASRNGIVGNELMLEHLHPNLKGYFIIANTFYEAMKEKQLIGSWKNATSIAEAWQEVPVTEIEQLRGLYTVLRLKANWPFQAGAAEPKIPKPRNLVEALALGLYQKRVVWVNAMQQLFTHYQKIGDKAQAVKVALILASALPYVENPQYVAGQMLINRGRKLEALRYLKRAAELAPNKTNNLLALSRAYLSNSKKEDAERTLRRLLQVDPKYKLAQRLLEQLE